MLLQKTFRYSVYIVGFLFFLHLVLPVYINSTFLGTIFKNEYIGFLYALSAVCTIAGITLVPRFMQTHGGRRSFLFLLLIEICALLTLAFLNNPIAIIIAFIFHFALTTIIPIHLDIFLESASENDKTGNIRGAFLTVVNIAWLITPIITGFILGSTENFWKVYFISALTLIPLIFISSKLFRRYQERTYKIYSLKGSIKKLLERKDITSVFSANLLLKMFFSWMVIYTPLFLHEEIGFDFSTIGIIMSIMLIAFVLVELPLGILADKILGEKEILVTGFFISALSTALLSFLNSTNWITWAIILFITRIGAAAVEVMTDTHFFKKVDPEDTHLISLYRMTHPLSYIIAPLLASIFFIFFDYQWIFLASGFVLLIGLIPSLLIQDSK